MAGCIKGRGPVGKGITQRADESLIGGRAHVLPGDTARSDGRIERAHQRQRNPEPRLDVPERKDVILPTEVPAVLASRDKRMMATYDHQPARANGKAGPE